MKTSDFPAVKEARETVNKQVLFYQSMMGGEAVRAKTPPRRLGPSVRVSKARKKAERNVVSECAA